MMLTCQFWNSSKLNGTRANIFALVLKTFNTIEKLPGYLASQIFYLWPDKKGQ